MTKFQDRCVIRDKDGKVIQSSRNLAGIRRFAAKNIIKKLDIAEVSGPLFGEGELSILFEDGSNFQTHFASFQVLKGWVSRWRNAYGAPLSINGVDSGVVSSKWFNC